MKTSSEERVARPANYANWKWFFVDIASRLQDFLQSLKCETGGVYRFTGSFRNYKFTGTVARAALLKAGAL